MVDFVNYSHTTGPVGAGLAGDRGAICNDGNRRGVGRMEGLTPPGESIGFLVYRLHQAMRERLEERLAPLGLTPSEWGALNHCLHGVDTPAGLAACLGVNRAAVTRLLDGLERAGLVERAPNPADGRSTLLRPTEPGRRLARHAAECCSEIDRIASACLDATGRARFLDLLRRVVGALSARDPDRDECP